MSHTAQISVDYSHGEALALAVAKMGGRILGKGAHALYGSVEQGLGILLPGWTYPIVVKSDNTLAFDHYNGAWGRPADLDKLHSEYSWAATEIAAQRVGWQTERTADGVIVYHPSGATITVTDANVSLEGFSGGACIEAMKQLALPTENVQAKPAMGQCQAECQEGV